MLSNLSVPQEGKISASMLIHNFPVKQQHLEIQVSLPPDNITLKPSKKKTLHAFHISRLALMQQLMPIKTPRILFLVPELLLLI